MLDQFAAVATVAVSDLARAKAFYQDLLALELLEERPGVMTFRSGGVKLFVYQSQFSGTNQATAVTWPVADVEPLAVALKAKGLRFEHYDTLPGLKLKGDVHIGDAMKAAWFKDPDGNVLSIVSGG